MRRRFDGELGDRFPSATQSGSWLFYSLPTAAVLVAFAVGIWRWQSAGYWDARTRLLLIIAGFGLAFLSGLFVRNVVGESRPITRHCWGISLLFAALAWAAFVLMADFPNQELPELPTIDKTADSSFRFLGAVMHGNYQVAHQIASSVLAHSKIEEWRFHPFTNFVEDVNVDYVPGYLEHLNDWIKQDKVASIPLLLRAVYYYDKGWATRGHAFASKTQSASMSAFAEDMHKALSDVRAAIHIDAQNPYSYYLELGILHGFGATSAMDSTFAQAFLKFPGYYPLYDIMLKTLQPRWGGNYAAMVAFVNRYAGATRDFSPMKLLYLDLYRYLLSSSSLSCRQYGGDQEKITQCVTSLMAKILTPALVNQVSIALHLYWQTDQYQFDLAVRPILLGMLEAPDGDHYSAAVLQMAAATMHSNTELKEANSHHNDYVIDEVVAAYWNRKGFYENALGKYREALTDARSGVFPNVEEQELAIGYIYEQMAAISGNSLHRYADMIRYEKSAIVHGKVWDEHDICFADYRLRHYGEAVRACTDVIRNTGNSCARYWRAMAYQDSGNTRAALRDFEYVADSENSFAGTAAIALSMIYFRRNDNAKALKVLNKYNYLYDSNRVGKADVAVAYNNRCYAYMQLGKLKKALHDCAESLRYGNIPDAYSKEQQLIEQLSHQKERPGNRLEPLGRSPA